MPDQDSGVLKRDYKLAFFDIDGTLLGFNGVYTERLKSALQAVQQAGIKTAIASGRPMFAAEFLIRELGLQAAGVFYTGALVHDPQTGRTLRQSPLAVEDVWALIASARALSLYLEVCTSDKYYIEKPHVISDKHARHLRCQPQHSNFEELDNQQPVIKLLLAVDSRSEHQLLYQLEAQFPHLIFAYAQLAEEPDWLFVSIISQDACKRAAFNELIEYHGVLRDQVIAFGDAQSDMEFLKLAGTGVAMGNATDAVKAVADYVTLPVWEDGVAHVLEQLL